MGTMLLFSSALKQFKELLPSSTEIALNADTASAEETLIVLQETFVCYRK